MIDMAARGGSRGLAGMNRYVLFGGAADAVRIADHKAAFIIGVRLQIQNAAGEHVWGGVIVNGARAHAIAAGARRITGDALATDAQHGQGRPPFALTSLAIEHRDRGVTVGIPADAPFEAQG